MPFGGLWNNQIPVYPIPADPIYGWDNICPCQWGSSLGCGCNRRGCPGPAIPPQGPLDGSLSVLGPKPAVNVRVVSGCKVPASNWKLKQLAPTELPIFGDQQVPQEPMLRPRYLPPFASEDPRNKTASGAVVSGAGLCNRPPVEGNPSFVQMVDWLKATYYPAGHSFVKEGDTIVVTPGVQPTKGICSLAGAAPTRVGPWRIELRASKLKRPGMSMLSGPPVTVRTVGSTTPAESMAKLQQFKCALHPCQCGGPCKCGGQCHCGSTTAGTVGCGTAGPMPADPTFAQIVEYLRQRNYPDATYTQEGNTVVVSNIKTAYMCGAAPKQMGRWQIKTVDRGEEQVGGIMDRVGPQFDNWTASDVISYLKSHYEFHNATYPVRGDTVTVLIGPGGGGPRTIPTRIGPWKIHRTYADA